MFIISFIFFFFFFFQAEDGIRDLYVTGVQTCALPIWFGDVLPFFRRLETDADFAGDWHGASGPLPIRLHPPAELNAVQLAFIDAARASGLSYAEDHNRPGALGSGRRLAMLAAGCV